MYILRRRRVWWSLSDTLWLRWELVGARCSLACHRLLLAAAACSPLLRQPYLAHTLGNDCLENAGLPDGEA